MLKEVLKEISKNHGTCSLERYPPKQKASFLRLFCGADGTRTRGLLRDRQGANYSGTNFDNFLFTTAPIQHSPVTTSVTTDRASFTENNIRQFRTIHHIQHHKTPADCSAPQCESLRYLVRARRCLETSENTNKLWADHTTISPGNAIISPRPSPPLGSAVPNVPPAQLSSFSSPRTRVHCSGGTGMV